MRAGIHIGHAQLYKDWHAVTGKLYTADELFQLIYYGQRNKKIVVFTYVLLDGIFRFSETGCLYQNTIIFFTRANLFSRFHVKACNTCGCRLLSSFCW